MEDSRPKGEGIWKILDQREREYGRFSTKGRGNMEDFYFPHQSLFTTTSFFGCIAQLVEHWAFNLMVAGSSPAIPKTYLTLYYL